jgi:hypothetical protein
MGNGRVQSLVEGREADMVDRGAKKLNKLVGIQADPQYVKCKCGMYVAIKFKTCPSCGREVKKI